MGPKGLIAEPIMGMKVVHCDFDLYNEMQTTPDDDDMESIAIMWMRVIIK